MNSTSANRAFVRLMILIAMATTLPPFFAWRTADLPQLLAFLAVSVPASYFRVGFSHGQGLVPLALLFVMISLRTGQLEQTLLLAATNALAFELGGRRSHGKNAEQVLFTMAVWCIAAVAGDYVLNGAPQPMGRMEVAAALQSVLLGVSMFISISFPEVLAQRLETGQRLMQAWKERHVWMMPYFVASALIAALFDVARSQFGWQIPLLLMVALYLPYRAYLLYLEKVEESLRHAEEMAALHLRTIEALALAIDAKDETTQEHLQRVQVYAVEIGKELGLSGRELEALRAAALLHDIGKLAVPEHIISKPGRLTPEEFERMKIHPVVGAQILERVRFPYPVAPIVRSHHERWDGNGYPDRLKGEEIPIGARILSVVDTLDALATDRHYRKALPLDEAVGIILQEAGKAFDPRVVEVLARRYRELEQMARARSVNELKLQKEVEIQGGEAPGAGFETAAQPAAAASQPDFLNQIAAARQEAHELFELAHNLGTSLSLDETLSVLSVRLKRIIPYDAMAVYLKKEKVLEPAFVTGENARLFSSLRIPVGQGLSGWVAETGREILNGNPSVEPGYLNDETKFSTLQSALAVPLEGLNGIIGVLTLYRAERNAFSRDHMRVLLAVCSKLALAVENALRYHQAESSATTDFLTGLPNARSLFHHLDNELARSRRLGGVLTLAVIDVDNFKLINDERGHLEGNRLLQLLGEALRTHCRESDYVARMGGDEFVLVLGGLARDLAPMRMAHLKRGVEEEVRAKSGYELALSVGWACYPEDGDNAEDLLSTADREMYRAKQSSESRRRTRARWQQWAYRMEQTAIQ
ncbi:MAG: diguanylate cyclase [Bryobacteraceae bacterium]|nr:diguanylate cyclase [Bryobacteraceae bacterium]